MSGYCKIAPGHEWHGPYHAEHYGFPISDDDELFERLILEINQAGLSWLTMLKKQQGFRDAYHGFKIAKVARYGERDRARLLNDAGIIRNKLKVNAAIENAKRIQALQKSHGSFAAWLAAHHPMTKPDWMKLFKKLLKSSFGPFTTSHNECIASNDENKTMDVQFSASTSRCEPLKMVRARVWRPDAW